MSNQTSDNNKRIAKNTLLLYVRMLFMMALSLYTSRIILNTLGVKDFGIYNVVGGIVGMFSFLNNSMSSATQRYITFSIGKGVFENQQKVFCTAVQIHIGIALLVALLGETVGLWFLYHKMQIPLDRIDAAFWVVQCSVLSAAIGIISVPYNAAVIAHEKMSAFAFMSILEVVLKLVLVFSLVIFNVDKLILFAVLLLLIGLFMRMCYGYYCHKHFLETRYVHKWDKTLLKEMSNFAGWSMFGNLAGVLYGQGLNMLLNVFFGPVVNAARGISVQVLGAVQQFVSNFQTALNPQITKNYANGNLTEMHTLMFRSARFSFFLLFFFALPVMLETNFILKVWLHIVPDNAVIFVRIMMCTSLIYTLSNPLIIANQATGKVKKYQAVCGTILLAILPISYICLSLGCPAYSVFIVHFVVEAIAQFARMIMLRPLIGIKIKDYFNFVYIKIFKVVSFSIVLPIVFYLMMDDTVWRFFVVCIACVLSVLLSSYFLGLSIGERSLVRNKVAGVISKLRSI